MKAVCESLTAFFVFIDPEKTFRAGIVKSHRVNFKAMKKLTKTIF